MLQMGRAVRRRVCWGGGLCLNGPVWQFSGVAAMSLDCRIQSTYTWPHEMLNWALICISLLQISALSCPKLPPIGSVRHRLAHAYTCCTRLAVAHLPDIRRNVASTRPESGSIEGFLVVMLTTALCAASVLCCAMR